MWPTQIKDWKRTTAHSKHHYTLRTQTIKTDVLYIFLHCTSINIVADTLPQVLFAVHLYSPRWLLVMLGKIRRFPSKVLPFSQNLVGEGNPAVTLHSTVKLLNSSSVLFFKCSTAGSSEGSKLTKVNFFPQESNSNVLKMPIKLHYLKKKKKASRYGKLWRVHGNVTIIHALIFVQTVNRAPLNWALKYELKLYWFCFKITLHLTTKTPIISTNQN